MALFAANPLSLSVPDSTFETWLRDSGYLDLLDDRAATAVAADDDTPTHPPSSAAAPPPPHSSQRFVFVLRSAASVSAAVRTIVAVLFLNPFAKLAADDFAGETPSWTVAFIGPAFSWPAGPALARMRVQENVKRYARNYAFLSLLIFGCSLYQMPKALLGLISCVGLWEALKYCSEKWGLEERFPGSRSVLVLFIQFAATAFVLYYCNLQIAILSAITISYAVMIIHASLRKLSPHKQTADSNRQKRSQPKR